MRCSKLWWNRKLNGEGHDGGGQGGQMEEGGVMLMPRITQKLVVGTVIMALMVLCLTPTGWAQRTRRPSPADFYGEEFGIGSLGGFIGLSVLGFSYGCPLGIADFMLGTRICIDIFGAESIDPGAPDALAFGGLLIFPITASLGVILDGAHHGINGSILGTIFVASMADVGYFLYGVATLQRLLYLRNAKGTRLKLLIFYSTWILITALGATLGYNLDAKMNTEVRHREFATMKIEVPLFEMRF